jgi:glycine betaine/proline transport system substrate-binding protein
MIKKRALLWLALLAAFALFVAACGDDDSDTTTADDGDDAAQETGDDGDDGDDGDMAEDDGDDGDDGDMAEDDGDDGDMAEDDGDDGDDGDMAEDDGDMEEMSATPGEGTNITMARADWSTGYFQAQLYKQLLEELGYGVTEPSELELGPSLAYLGMTQGDFDFWVNSWYPGHGSWWAPELPDGSTVGENLTIVGNEMIAGGLQGFLITKSFADEHGVTHLDQLHNDPDILAAFDADDQSPGNGVADIYGCTESWTCDDIIDSQIAFSDWTNIAQVKAGYDAMFAEATVKANAGEPMVIYTWTPSAYITELRPGDNVVWLATEDVLDDSNPTGLVGGEGHDQRPGQANIGPDSCPAAANADNCQLGWVAADIQVTANTEWLNANPYAAELFCQVTLSVIDVSLANVDQSNAGDDATEDFIAGLAADWISDNRDQADGWLDAARMPPMEPTCPDTVIPLQLQ